MKACIDCKFANFWRSTCLEPNVAIVDFHKVRGSSLTRPSLFWQRDGEAQYGLPRFKCGNSGWLFTRAGWLRRAYNRIVEAI